jgi:hypothetical protein
MNLITQPTRLTDKNSSAFATFGSDQQDQRFLKLLAALRQHGGMLPDDDVRRISFVSRPNFALGEALIRGDLYALNWRHQRWIPMFQFLMPGLRINATVSEVTAELSPRLQGFELTEWFTSTHPWLDHQSPLDIIDASPALVRNAARVDRILLAG